MSLEETASEVFPLELSSESMQTMVQQAMARIVEHIETLPKQPVQDNQDGLRIARSLAESAPEEGAPFEALLDLLFDRAIPCSINTAGPGFMAYIPAGGLFHAAVAELISYAVNRYVGVWLAAPGLVQIEVNVVRWFGEIIGYPEQSGGFLTSGGSLANLSALVTARQEKLPENFFQGILYVSDQMHHSMTKAAQLAGFPPGNVRTVPTDERFCMRIDILQQQLTEDQRQGLEPFLLVGNAGSTNTGAVDDLNAMADLATQENLWFHVDAAYGGFFCLTERGRRFMAGIERADSVTLDPHKGLFMPYGTGCLLVRDTASLKHTYASGADYMPEMTEDPNRVDFCQISPELSRECRGLRVWLPVKMHGLETFRQQLNEKLDLTQHAAEVLRSIPGIEILAEPQLSLVAFRLVLEGTEGDVLNKLNRQFMAGVVQRDHILITGTILPGNRFALRICILSFRTHQERLDQGLEDIRLVAEELRSPIKK